MSTVIGLAVASDELRAVLVRNGVVEWVARSARNPEPSLAAQIGALLARAPSANWRRPPVVATVGPAASQLKRLNGLPSLEDPRALAAVVREGASRFFLKNGVPLDVSGVRLVAPGGGWVTAFDAPVLLEIAAGCRVGGHRLLMVAPALVALGAALPDARVRWRDGGVSAEVASRGGALVSVRRSAYCDPLAPEDASSPVPAALSRFGADAWRFADAYGATMLSPAEALAVRPVGASEEAAARRRIRFAAATCALSVAIALAAPALWSAFDAARTSRALATLAPHARDAAAMEQELRRMSSALGEVAAFEAERGSPITVLAGLTRALPAGAALVTIRLDSTGGMLVVLAPRAARVVASLDGVAGVAVPEIVGPVTLEVVGTREMERATVRFRLVRGASR